MSGAVDETEIRTAFAFETVVREGDPGEGLYLVRSGSLLATIERGDERHIVGQLGPGDVFGELALLRDGSHVAATVTAVRPSSTAFLPTHRVCELMSANPTVAQAIMSALDAHQRRIIQVLSTVVAS